MLGVILFALGDAVYVFFDIWANSPSPEEIIRRRTNEDVQTVQIHPGKPTSATISTLCGGFLAEAMRQNNNRCSVIIVGMWGDNRTPGPGENGANQGVVNVVFPDGKRAYMDYYQYPLISCRELPSRSEFF